MIKFKEYLDIVKSHITKLLEETNINTRKLQLDIKVNTKNILNPIDKRIFVAKSTNVETTPTGDINEVTTKLINSLHSNFDKQLLISRKGSNFKFSDIEELNIHIHQINLKRGSSYVKTPEWIKNKKATINPYNTNDEYCFAHSIVISLYHEQIGKNPQRNAKLRPYCKHFDWTSINFPTGLKEWKEFEKNNPDISLNILSVPFQKEQINIEYASKFNRDRKNQITLLMIRNGEEISHYLALKSIPAENQYIQPSKSFSRLMNGYSSKHNRDFYCYHCLSSYTTDNAFKKHELPCKDHDYCEIILPDDEDKILKHEKGTKSLKCPYTVYLYLECIQPKYESCSNNPNKPYTQLVTDHIVSAYALYLVDQNGENKIQYDSGKNC